MEFKDLLNTALADAHINASEDQLMQADRFTQKLLEINESMNLTAITEAPAMVEKHWLDSLAMGRVQFEKGEKILDVGSGAGFPGVPLCIFFADSDFTLLDSLQKRLTFIEGATQYAGIPTPTLLHARAEQAGHSPQHRERYDTVLSRAVANLTTLCEYCLPFVKVGGRMIAYKGPDAANELAAALPAIEKLGGKVDKTDTFTLPAGEERNLIYISKISPCAPCYPRSSKAIKNKALK